MQINPKESVAAAKNNNSLLDNNLTTELRKQLKISGMRNAVTASTSRTRHAVGNLRDINEVQKVYSKIANATLSLIAWRRM